MTNPLSLYLDALRFAAALTVFISHFGTGRISGGLFWYLADYGRTAVLVFFVLSGFVIAWVAETRERNLEDFALSRVARLYSVIVPAFLLTAVLDWAGSSVDSRLYGPEWNRGLAHPALGYTLSAAFLGESWTIVVLPGFNVPFWSLNYEAWCYILFAAFVFLRGRLRIATFGLAALITGPKTLLLFPIWLMGVAAWHCRARVRPRMGKLLLAGSLVGLIALEGLGGQRLFQRGDTPWLPPSYSAYDYVLGAFAALFILGLANVQLPMPALRTERLVRALAGTTFGLYMIHYPLLNFFATVVPGPPEGTGHRVLVFALALGGGLGLARLMEPRKKELKRALRSMIDLMRGAPVAPALATQQLPSPDTRSRAQ